MARLSLHFLGPFHVTLGEVPLTDFRYDHVRALLAYLAVEARQPHQRETLAAFLWPDQPNRTSLENLRYALYHLRRTIGDRDADPPFLLISRDTLQFNPAADYTLDIALFAEWVASTQAATLRLEQAVELYRGPFLEGFSLGNSYPFEEWLLQKREQMDRQILSALHRLAETHEQQGNYEQSAKFARQMLSLDPLDERNHRQLMRVLALDGQRSAALTQYETCREMLQVELDVEPEPATIGLHMHIREGRLEAADHPSGHPQRSSLVPTTFVGRKAELQHLGCCLETMLAGRGQTVLVAGEAGSGKTTLLAEFTRQAIAAHPQLVVACGSCSLQGSVGDPYLPFREVLQALSGDIGIPLSNNIVTQECADRQWAIAPVTIQALGQIGLHLIHRMVNARALALRAEVLFQRRDRQTKWYLDLQRMAEGEGTPLVVQESLFEQYTRVLQTVARVRPLLLLLDDLQWADTGSISLLFHLGRRLANQRILLVGAYRSDEVAAGRGEERHPLEPILHEFQCEREDCEVNLDQAAGRDFVQALLDSEPNRLDGQFRESLYEHTGGHALFTVEMLHSLQERGGLRRDAGGQWVQGLDLNWSRLPPRVEAVIAERVARMSEELQAILAAASVEGETFTAEVIARVQGIQEQQVLRHLSHELGRRYRLVRAEELAWRGGKRLSRYRFQHHLFQHYLYYRLDPIERGRIHQEVLAALEELYRDQKSELAAMLAQHAEAAGLVDRAADYWFQAGQRAFTLAANDEAVALYRRSLAALAALPDSPQRARREMETQLALAASLFLAHGWGAAEQTEAAQRAYQLSQHLAEPAHRLPLLLALSSLHAGHGEYEQARTLTEQALLLAQTSGNQAQIALAHEFRGLCLLFLADLRTGRDHLERSLTICPSTAECHLPMLPVGGIDVRVGAHIWLGYCLWLLGYPDQAGRHVSEGIRLAEQMEHPASLAGALTLGCTVIGVLTKRVQAVLTYSERLLRLSDEKGLSFGRSWGLIYQGWARIHLGQTTGAIAQMCTGLEALRRTGTLATHPHMQTVLAEAYLHVGQTEKGLETLEAALAEAKHTRARSSVPEMLRLKGDLMRATLQPGADEQAAEFYAQSLSVARQQDARMWELRTTVSLARLWQVQGRQAEAREMLAAIYDWFTEGFDTADLQEAHALLQKMQD